MKKIHLVGLALFASIIMAIFVFSACADERAIDVVVPKVDPTVEKCDALRGNGSTASNTRYTKCLTFVQMEMLEKILQNQEDMTSKLNNIQDMVVYLERRTH